MTAPFDPIAAKYDTDFTQSAIGKLQRNQVWDYLGEILPGLNGIEILELNCGTGEDALRFGKMGFNVLATDISQNMLSIANKKAGQEHLEDCVATQYLDLTTIETNIFSKKFDLVFSNFGGLNCISPSDFKKLLNNVSLLLNPGGRFIAVIMPKFCVWEMFYFFSRFKFDKVFRRLTNEAIVASLQGSYVQTWYYGANQIKNWAKDFTVINKKPVGIALPPSYLESFFSKKENLLSALTRLEKNLSQMSFLSSFADHYIIDMELK